MNDRSLSFLRDALDEALKIDYADSHAADVATESDRDAHRVDILFAAMHTASQDRAFRAEASLRGGETPGPWQPIATAPTDGTVILVGGDGWCSVGHYGDEDMPRWWTTHPCLVGVRPQVDHRGAKPTHWMPLPPAPAGTGAQRPEPPQAETLKPREGVWNPNGEGEQADVPGGRAKDNAREKKPVIAYACLYTRLVEVARAHGYALAMHGSLIADCDLIAVPWVESASTDEELAEALRAASAGVLMTDPAKTRVAGVRKHVIHLGGGPYLDITVVPLKPSGDEPGRIPSAASPAIAASGGATPRCTTCRHMKTTRDITDEYRSVCQKFSLDVTDTPEMFGCTFWEDAPLAASAPPAPSASSVPPDLAGYACPYCYRRADKCARGDSALARLASNQIYALEVEQAQGLTADRSGREGEGT